MIAMSKRHVLLRQQTFTRRFALLASSLAAVPLLLCFKFLFFRLGRPCLVLSCCEYLRDLMPFQSDHDSRCQSCSRAGELLLCDGCTAAWHPTCLKPPLALLPEGDWYCPSCAVGVRSLSPFGCYFKLFPSNRLIASPSRRR